MTYDALTDAMAHAGVSLLGFQVRLMLQGGGALVGIPPFAPIDLGTGHAVISRRVDTQAGPRTAIYLVAA